ncbi:SDR family NAD(P)-dependent oxidoreductase [uncultured Massilia sp.]|uniref:SDR family NAD(P)-dependent oxidoreductase n=1 Tax=uncultured Massilia sp. TaxID=169973 RepID=UPI0025E85B2B|nr:SDR family NAD(P)-dependent oxidoreductase [uncultured Massilia sp.]
MARTALVTGGTRGLGAAIALALRDRHCRVVATWHDDAQAARRMEDETGVTTLRADVTDFAACAAAVADVERRLGPVDILVNNAGITADAAFHRMEAAQWRSGAG